MFDFLNVVSNLAYLAPAYMLLSRRMYGEATWFVIATAVSSTYHMCRGGNVCMGIDQEKWRLLDHNIAYIAVAQTVLVFTAYKLVRVSRGTRRIARKIQHGARALHPEMIFVETRFAQASRAFYIAAIIAANVLFFDTLLAYLLLVAVGALISLVNFSVAWRLGLKEAQGSYVWVAFGLSIFSALVTAALFLTPEENYKFFHPAWHTSGATTAVYVIYSASRSARVYTAREALL